MSKTYLSKSDSFPVLLNDIKSRIQQAQTRMMLSVNAELIQLYWDIGRIIDNRQRRERRGTAVVPRLSRELANKLREEKGFSGRNIKRMLAFIASTQIRLNFCRRLRHNWIGARKCCSLRHNCPTRSLVNPLVPSRSPDREGQGSFKPTLVHAANAAQQLEPQCAPANDQIGCSCPAGPKTDDEK